MIFVKFYTVNQHCDRKWNGNCILWYQPLNYSPSPWKVNHRSGVYVPYSLLIAVCICLHPMWIRTGEVLWDGTTMEVKSVGTFPVILLKLATPPLPPQTKLNLEQNGWKWVLFLATTLLGEVGGRRDEPKAEQKIVLRSRVLRNYCLEGLFHTVPSSFVLHCRIVSLSLVIREFIISNHNGDSKENVN